MLWRQFVFEIADSRPSHYRNQCRPNHFLLFDNQSLTLRTLSHPTLWLIPPGYAQDSHEDVSSSKEREPCPQSVFLNTTRVIKTTSVIWRYEKKPHSASIHSPQQSRKIGKLRNESASPKHWNSVLRRVTNTILLQRRDIKKRPEIDSTAQKDVSQQQSKSPVASSYQPVMMLN